MRLAFLAGTILVLMTACSAAPATNTSASTAGGGGTAAPGGGTTTPGGGGNPAADQVSCNDGVVGSEVSIVDFGFEPATIAADADETVNWTNNGSATHTVTFDNGKDCGSLASGDTLTVLFNAPGSYAYHCTIHSSMKGTVTVG